MTNIDSKKNLHILGVDPNLINKVQDPYFLDQIAQTFKEAAAVSESFAPWTKPWVGESGGAYNSGGKTVSHTFADGFWFNFQLFFFFVIENFCDELIELNQLIYCVYVLND